MNTLYSLQLKEFEKKYKNVLVEVFKELNSNWKKYPIKYNKKKELDYTSFVRYCYDITDKQYDI